VISETGSHARRITLDEALQQAGDQEKKIMGRMGELEVEAAKQHRLGAESDYFPKISSSLFNIHFNKFMGEQFTVQRPIAGGTATILVPLVGKDQTLIAATAAQPITPLFKIHQLVNLARADEEIAKARAKAGLPPQTAAKVEERYFGLLVAQREQAMAIARASDVESRQLNASSSSPRVPSGSGEDELTEAANAMAEANIKVQELNASLNEVLGWPSYTVLELAPPAPLLEAISLQEATEKALAANAQVVEAEQTLAKARAASTLSKLEYVPDVAVLGGYVYNGNALPALPRDFSYIGLVATYTLFDFGKREHSIKERKAQVEMAEIGVQLTKAKVAAAVKSSYLQMERSRQLSELRHHMASALQLRNASSDGGPARSLTAGQAKAEAAMFEADLAYRQAFTRLKEKIGQ